MKLEIRFFFKEAGSDVVDDFIKIIPELDNFPSIVAKIRSDVQKMKSFIPDLEFKASKETHWIVFRVPGTEGPLYGSVRIIERLDPTTNKVVVPDDTVSTRLKPIYGYEARGIEEIERYLNKVGLKGKKVKGLLDRFFSRDFEIDVYKAFGDIFVPDSVIGRWLQVCLSSKNPSNLIKTIESTPGRNLEMKWAKMLSEAYSFRNSARLPLKSIILNKEKILEALCDPIEIYVFGKPVTRNYL